MKTRKALRLGVLVAVVVALLSTWAFVSAADGQLASVSLNSNVLYSKQGVATLSGLLNCAGYGTVQISGTLIQSVGKKSSIVASFGGVGSCGPASPGTWSAMAVPLQGRFGGGDAIVTGSFYGSFQVQGSGYYPPYPNCYIIGYDWMTNTYTYQCYVSGPIGPTAVKMVND
jgi:hypothetical protein